MIDVHLDVPTTRDRHCYEGYMRHDAPMTRTITERELCVAIDHDILAPPSHTNLFLAYFELKARAEGGGEPGGKAERE